MTDITPRIVACFGTINTIPRCSKNEARISAWLCRCREVYQRLYRQSPEVAVIHAGLECAVIGDRFAGMDMISFGPTIQNLHSPAERLHLPSLGRVWDFLTALLAAFASDAK
jgi:dipeptidase D